MEMTDLSSVEAYDSRLKKDLKRLKKSIEQLKEADADAKGGVSRATLGRCLLRRTRCPAPRLRAQPRAHRAARGPARVCLLRKGGTARLDAALSAWRPVAGPRKGPRVRVCPEQVGVQPGAAPLTLVRAPGDSGATRTRAHFVPPAFVPTDRVARAL